MSSRSEITIRPAQRPLICRGCNKNVAVGEEVLYTYSNANSRGQHIFFCMACLDVIVDLRKQHSLKQKSNFARVAQW